jgi:hypothetical protein
VNDPEFQRIIADGDLPARILDKAGKQWRRISWMLVLTGFLLMAFAFGLAERRIILPPGFAAWMLFMGPRFWYALGNA